ncbi:hypothetical protein DFS34DRAFT_645092 [Phlyctochytrium arcticum]|nr:hypothetical protein DFS34DRAFT_645092 [Phlyctochytrium arcticum]
MGVPVPPASAVKINLSHQEVARIIEELEKSYLLTNTEWIAAEPISEYLSRELGYEDMEEFKDALGGTFEDFLKALPNVRTKVDEKDALVFKVIPELAPEDWKPRKMTLKITDIKQLWNVLLKSAYATIEIPELEFAIQRNGQKRIDSIYNHIGNAIFELGAHVKSVQMPEESSDKIIDCITTLNALLDVPAPWTCVVQDPSGISEFSDMSGVEIGEITQEE